MKRLSDAYAYSDFGFLEVPDVQLAVDIAIVSIDDGLTFDEFKERLAKDPTVGDYDAEDAWITAEEILDLPHANVH